MSEIGWISQERGDRAIADEEPGYQLLGYCDDVVNHGPGEPHYHLGATPQFARILRVLDGVNYRDRVGAQFRMGGA